MNASSSSADPGFLLDDISGHAIILVDPQGRVTRWSRGASRISGREPESAIGRRIEDLLVADDAPPWSSLLDDSSDPEGRVEGWFRAGPDRLLWMKGSVTRMRSADGPIGHCLILEDATEERSREEQLRSSEELFTGILEIATDAVVSVGEDQRITFFNQGAERIFGYARDEIIGERLEVLIPGRFRADHERQVHEFGRSGVRARQMGERGGIWGLRKGGEDFPAEASISQIDVQGRRIYTAVLRDVTERRRVEEELNLLRTVAIAIGEAEDLDEALSVTLERVCRVTGWAAGDAWLPRADGSVIEHAVSWAADEDALRSFSESSHRCTFAPGQGLIGEAWEMAQPAWIPDVAHAPRFVRTKTAVAVDLRQAVAVPVLSDQSVVAVLGFYHYLAREEDARQVNLVAAVAAQLGAVVQRKRIEEALAEQAQELSRSNADLEQFAYVASHDLQEPLRMVASYTQLLARRYRDQLDEDANEFIDFAVDGVTRMQALINDLLAYSRVGTHGGKRIPVEAEEIMAEVVSDLRSVIEENEARVTHDPLPEVEVDPGQLRQLLQNLVANAIKFRGEQPPHVHVRAEREEDAWRFSVDDNGIGIEPEFAERIFVLFQRLHARTEYPGTGIGLAICKKIVERHGGRIWVEGGPGRGSTFHFTIADQ